MRLIFYTLHSINKNIYKAMRFEAVTIKDIAKALNLSTSTISRALQDSYQISDKTKKKILAYAKKINYQPNPIALSLKERKSYTIGVLVGEIANSFFSQALDGIESIANQNGYTVIIALSHEKLEKEITSLQQLTSRSVDGLLVSVSVETDNFTCLKELHTKGMPIVFFDRIVNEINTHKVIADNYKGAYDATVHLIQNGCTNIAVLANVAFLSITKERLEGHIAALKDNGFVYNPKQTYHCKPGPQLHSELETAIKKIVKLKNRPDGILSLTDQLTTGCLKYLKKEKISLPKDMKIIGFSNNDLTEILQPSLSVIKQPAYEMGKIATQFLLKLIESKKPVTEFLTTVLPSELVVRESSVK
jgi:DNA-binding LacI/PurR family transcriptional regulator